MQTRKLLSMTGKQKKRDQQANAAKQIAIGVGIVAMTAAAGVATGILVAPKSGKETRKEMKDNVASFNDAVQKKTDTFKKSAVFHAQKAANVVKDVHEKTVDVTKDIGEGIHAVAHEVHNTAGHIVNEFNNL